MIEAGLALRNRGFAGRSLRVLHSFSANPPVQIEKTLENPNELGDSRGNCINSWTSQRLTSLNKMCAKR